MTAIQYKIYFTAKNGAQAEITGDLDAIRAIEQAFERAGIKYHPIVATFDEGYYSSDPKDYEPDGDDYADRAEWKARL